MSTERPRLAQGMFLVSHFWTLSHSTVSGLLPPHPSHTEPRNSLHDVGTGASTPQPAWLSPAPCTTANNSSVGVGADPLAEERSRLIDASRTNPSWTLVIMMGQPRSVAFTADQIVANLLLLNEPCHLSVVLDTVDWDGTKVRGLPAHASAAFKPWLVSERVVRPPRLQNGAHIEFRLARAALEYGMQYGARRGVRYEYLVSTRTDLFVSAPVCVKAWLGYVDASRLATLMERLDASVTAATPAGQQDAGGSTLEQSWRWGNDARTLRLVVRWLLGGGSTAVAIARSRAAATKQSFTRWCPAVVPKCNHANATRGLEHAALSAVLDAHGRSTRLRWPSAHVTASTNASVQQRTPADVDASTAEGLQKLVQRVARTQRVLSVLGNTWLRFGAAAVLGTHLRDSVAHYGRSFRSVVGVDPPPRRHPDHMGKWVNYSMVTEAQLRLSVWATHATLIEVPMPYTFPKATSPSLLQIQQKVATRPAAQLVRKGQVAHLHMCSRGGGTHGGSSSNSSKSEH